MGETKRVWRTDRGVRERGVVLEGRGGSFVARLLLFLPRYLSPSSPLLRYFLCVIVCVPAFVCS